MGSILYAVNSISQPIVSTDTTLNFGDTIIGNKCCGKTIYICGGNVCIDDSGIFAADVNATILASANGTFFVQVYNNGVEVAGAKAVVYVANGAYTNVQIPFVINKNCKATNAVSVVISGNTGSVENAAIRVTKL